MAANKTQEGNGTSRLMRPLTQRSIEPIAPRLLTAKQAAVYLNVSHWTVRSLTWAGELPSVPIGKRQLRWDMRDLDGFIEARKQRERD